MKLEIEFETVEELTLKLTELALNLGKPAEPAPHQDPEPAGEATPDPDDSREPEPAPDPEPEPDAQPDPVIAARNAFKHVVTEDYDSAKAMLDALQCGTFDEVVSGGKLDALMELIEKGKAA